MGKITLKKITSAIKKVLSGTVLRTLSGDTDCFRDCCPNCCNKWWCIEGDPEGCFTVTTGDFTGDAYYSCSECDNVTYKICQDGGGYTGTGASMSEDPDNPGNWLFSVCGVTFQFTGFDFVEAFGGPVDQPGPCTTDAAAHIFIVQPYCFFGTEAEAVAEAAAAGYGYSGPYDTELECNYACSPPMPLRAMTTNKSISDKDCGCKKSTKSTNTNKIKIKFRKITKPSAPTSPMANWVRPSGKPRVLFVADVPNWSFDRKSKDYAKFMPEWEIDTSYANSAAPKERHFLANKKHYDVILFLHDAYIPDNKKLKEYIDEKHAESTKVILAWNYLQTAEQLERRKERISLFDAIGSNNPKMLSVLQSMGYNPFYTPDGYNPETFRLIKPFDERPFKIGFVSSKTRLNHKGYPQFQQLQKLLEPEGFQFDPIISDSFQNTRTLEEMNVIYNDWKVYVCMSESEGGPCPLFESAPVGVIPICTPVGYSQDYKNIFIIENRNDIDAFSEKIRYLRDNPEVSKKMSDGIATEAPIHSTPVVAPMWQKFIGSVL